MKRSRPAEQRGAAAMSGPSPLPEGFRPWLVAGTLLAAGAFGWAAFVLPWRTEAPLGLGLWMLAVAHLCTALAAYSPARLERALRVLAVGSLCAAPVFAWAITSTSVRMVQMYGALGWGLTAALAAIGWLLMLATVPVAFLGWYVTRARHEPS